MGSRLLPRHGYVSFLSIPTPEDDGQQTTPSSHTGNHVLHSEYQTDTDPSWHSQNGIGAFILQCKRLDFYYCNHAGSSRGMNNFLSSSLLTRFTAQYPQTEFRISPRPAKHPVLRAYYVNGREKAVCVRNLEKEQVESMAEYLVGNSGNKVKKVGSRKVLSSNPNVRGIWSPMHGGIKSI